MEEEALGKVIHYYDRAMVAVVRLTGGVRVGDSLKFVHHDSEFSQPVSSMEIDHKKIQSAKKGEEVAIKMDKATHEGAFVYKEE